MTNKSRAVIFILICFFAAFGAGAVSNPGGYLVAGGETKIYMKWVNPADADFLRVEILRDGAKIYEGVGQQYIDGGALAGKVHTYAIRSLDKNLNKSAGISAFVKLGDKTDAEASALISVPIEDPLMKEGGGGVIFKPGTTSPVQIRPNYPPLTAAYTFGQKGESVSWLQRYLVHDASAQFLTSNITGYYGLLTKAAVARFQKQYGIEQTGIAGPITRKKLNDLYSSVSPANPQIEALLLQIRSLQAALEALRAR